MLREKSTFPARQHRRMQEYLPDGNGRDYCIERKVERDQCDRNTDGFLEPFEENPSQDTEQNQCHGHLALHPNWRKRVLYEVGGGIGGGERHGNDEIGRCETEQN